MKSKAIFSSCGEYRYSLIRTWDASKPKIVFLLLNPSTADESKNDPTIERCQRRATAMGFGSIYIVNIFALKSTDPSLLYDHSDPVGPENDRHILKACREADLIICGWGKHGNFMGRGSKVLSVLYESRIDFHVLAVNRDGTPRHPLYVPYSKLPIPRSRTSQDI